MSPGPNIIWISLESFRYDHTSLSGYRRDTTPRIRELANESGGVSFDHCIAHGKWTGTSSASMLTGTYPPTHGVYGASETVVPDSVKTVPEILSDKGYYSVGLSPNPNAGFATGLDRGFDEFKYINKSDIRSLIDEVGLRTLMKIPSNLWQHGGGITTDFQRHKGLSSYILTDYANRFVSQHSSDRPFFLYMHYNSSHRSYQPPESHVDKYTDSLPFSAKTAMQVAQSKYEDVSETIANGTELSNEELDTITAMYDAVVRHVDHCVGEVIDAIRDEVGRETIFVITGDHGDLLGEYGLLGHKLVLHDALVHVPLVTFGLEDVKKNSDEVVQHIDLVKTLLSEAGVQHPQLEGIDLTRNSREYAVTQRAGQNARKNLAAIREHDPEYELRIDHPATLTAFRSTEFKLLYSRDGIDLFELPDETTDVHNRYPGKTSEMRAFAEEWLEAHPAPTDSDLPAADLDPETRERLSDMGYLV